MSIFKKRTNIKPDEYPQLRKFVDAMRHTFWIHTEVNITGDIQDFLVRLSNAEKSATKRSILSIAQVELSVKRFWGDLYKMLPKPEIDAVGATFAESEIRHSDAYAFLIEQLGLQEEFDTLNDTPVMKDRVDVLEGILSTSLDGDKRFDILKIILFAICIENVSLFSSFYTMLAFRKKKQQLTGIATLIEWTSKEENNHAEFGFELVDIIKEEHPELFDKEMEETIYMVVRESYDAEMAIVNWIFEEGELNFLPKHQVINFLENRYNESLERLDLKPIFNVDSNLVKEDLWFEEVMNSSKNPDFFFARSTDYTARNKPITADDLF